MPAELTRVGPYTVETLLGDASKARKKLEQRREGFQPVSDPRVLHLAQSPASEGAPSLA